MKRMVFTFLLVLINSFTFAEVSLESFNRRVTSFCSTESSASLRDQSFTLTRQLKVKTCVDNNNVTQEIPESLLDIYGYPRTRVVEKSLKVLCSNVGKRKWEKHKLMAHNSNFELPKDPCVCDMVNNFDLTKKLICSNEDDKHPIKRLVQKNTDKVLITQSIQQEREAEHLLDQMRYYGVKNFCGEIEEKCEEVEALYSDIDLELSEDEKLYSFVKNKKFNPAKYLTSLKGKKGSFFQPRLELKSETLEDYLKTKRKDNNVGNASFFARSSSSLQELIGKPSHQYMLNMNKLRVEVSESGNSFSKYIEKNSNSVDSNKVIQNFCKFNKGDSEELKKIKIDILTHDSLSRFSCADDASTEEIERNSKALVDLINKSSKNVKTHQFLADAIKDDLREKFLEEVPERCEKLKQRAKFLCRIPSLKVNEITELANQAVYSDSRAGLINQNAERFVDLSLEGIANKSLSCLMGPKVENDKIGALVEDNELSLPRDGKTVPLPSEADRSVAEQKAQYDKKMAELAMADSVRKKVRAYAEKKGIKKGSKEYGDLVNQFEDYIPKSLRGQVSIGMNDLEFFNAKSKLEDEFKSSRDRGLNKVQESLVQKYSSLASKPNGLKYYKDNLKSMKNDIDEVARITGNKAPQKFVDKYFSTKSPATKVVDNSVFRGPTVYQNAPGVKVRNYGGNVTAAVLPQEIGDESEGGEENISTVTKGKIEAKIKSSSTSVSSSNSSSSRAPASFSQLNLKGTSLLVKNSKELDQRVIDFTSEVQKEGFGIIYISGEKVFKKLVRDGEEEAKWPREIKLSEFENDQIEDIKISFEEIEIMKKLVLNSKKRINDLDVILNIVNE